MKTPEVCDSILILTTEEIVFNTLTDSEQLSKWWPKSAISEPMKNGKLIFYWFNESEIEKHYKSFVKNKEVSFGFGTEFVLIKLYSVDDKVKVDVCHSKINPGKYSDSLIHIAQSWTLLLINLKAYIEYGIDFGESK